MYSRAAVSSLQRCDSNVFQPARQMSARLFFSLSLEENSVLFAAGAVTPEATAMHDSRVFRFFRFLALVRDRSVRSQLDSSGKSLMTSKRSATLAPFDR